MSRAVLALALLAWSVMNFTGTQAAVHTMASSSGVLLVENLNGRMVGNRSQAATAGQVVSVRDGTVHLLARLPRIPYTSHLAPSPDGRHVVIASGQAGLWAVNSDGSGRHTLLTPPPTSCQNGPFATGNVAWAPGGQRLAYGVFLDSDVIRSVVGLSCPRLPWGVWMTSYAPPSRRQLWESMSGGGGLLSWSPGAPRIVANAVIRVGRDDGSKPYRGLCR